MDPDHEALSLLAILWITSPVIIFGPIPLLPSAVFIGAARFLIRIIGLPLRPIEALAILVMPLILMLFYHDWVFGLLAVLTFSLEAYFEKFPRKESFYALIAIIFTIVYIIFTGLPAFIALSPMITTISILITVLTLIKLVRIQPPQSRSDFNDKPISLARLRTVIAISLLIALLNLRNGDAGFLLLAPLWAALLTAAL